MASRSKAEQLEQLKEVLREAQHFGFIGRASLETQIEHSMAFSSVVAETMENHSVDAVRLADLGSGGGIPGLLLAVQLAGQALVSLIESSAGRATFLEGAVRALGLDDCFVLPRRAEEVARDPETRASFEVVTARAFGSPGVVAECGAPLLRVGGSLIVSEPPRPPEDRWPDEEVAIFGLSPAVRVEVGQLSFVVLTQEDLCPIRFPRRTGVPEKRPIF